MKCASGFERDRVHPPLGIGQLHDVAGFKWAAAWRGLCHPDTLVVLTTVAE
jgi:hypothetical protein